MNLPMLKIHAYRGLLLAAGLLAGTGGCATPSPTPVDLDPVARREIDRMRDAMSRLPAYQLSAESISDEALPSGQWVQVTRTSTVHVAQPDRLAITVTRDSGESWSAWLSDGNLVLLDETTARFTRISLPVPINEALEELADRYELYLPLADIVSGLRRADLLAQAESGLYVGTDTIAGQACHHVLFRQPVADWQAWIHTDDPALPRQILLMYKDEPGNPSYQVTITEWNTDPQFDDTTWQPNLPPDAREVALADLLNEEESP